MQRYEILCPNEGEETHQTHPDHYPLDLEEVTRLLHIALNDYRTRTSIQRRLIQAIPDMTCPPPTEGLSAKRMKQVTSYFSINIDFDGGDPLFAEEIYDILYGDGKKACLVD